MTKEPHPAQDVFDAGGRGLQHQDLRRANERAVMTIVGFNPGVSNAEISRLSGLAPQTISAILTDIERAGLISRGEVLRGRRGQPATPIFLNPDGAYAFGIEVSWRHMDVLLIDMHAQIRRHLHIDYAYPDAGTIVADLVKAMSEVGASLPAESRHKIADVGIAMPTGIWRYLDLVDAPPEQRQLWEDLDIAGQLANASGLEVALFNDGNAACWAELIASPRPRPADFIYFMVSHYIAAGIVGQGTLWEGSTGNSANLGSMLVHKGIGPPQAAHFVASISALEQRLDLAGFPPRRGGPADWDWDSFEPVLSDWLDAAASALAEVVFNTNSVLESQLAIIDGMMPRPIVVRLVEGVQAKLAALPSAPFLFPQVTMGHLGETAPALGAAELRLYRRHISRTTDDVPQAAER